MDWRLLNFPTNSGKNEFHFEMILDSEFLDCKKKIYSSKPNSFDLVWSSQTKSSSKLEFFTCFVFKWKFASRLASTREVNFNENSIQIEQQQFQTTENWFFRSLLTCRLCWLDLIRFEFLSFLKHSLEFGKKKQPDLHTHIIFYSKLTV